MQGRIRGESKKHSLNKERFVKGPLMIVICFCIVSLLSACAREKPPDLGYFTKISALSISSDGNSILFDGCGHKDHKECTIYRFDRSTNRMYRYVRQKESEQISGGRYASGSSRFLFLRVPLDEKKKPQLEDVQIALVNEDGTGFRQITEGKGVKAAYMLSYDEKNLIFFMGKKRDEGKTLASHFDLYKLDLETGKSTQLTRLGFYGVGEPCFTPDGKNVVFEGEAPLRLPYGNDPSSFQDFYRQKYQSNVILQYPLDGSGIERLPKPLFVFGSSEATQPGSKRNLSNGSRDPKVTKDGSIWFEGRSGSQGFIGYYRRFPDGRIQEIPYAQLGISHNRAPFQEAISWDAVWMVILNEDMNTRQRSIGMLNTLKGQYYEITVPAQVENISVR